MKPTGREIEKAVTLADIAKRTDFSTVTVSKALRNHPDISEETTSLIKTVAEEMGYTPNIMARNLSSRKTNTIGLVVPKIAHDFFGSIIEHIYNIAFENNYEIILTVSQENVELEKKQLQTLMAMKIDGIIISITKQTKDYEIFELIKSRGVPIVFIDRVPELQSVNTVTVDDFGGAYKTVIRAVNNGYRKIGYFSGYSEINIGRLRKDGFYSAMQDSGIEVNPAWVTEGGFDEQSGYDAFMKLYKENNLPEFLITVTFPVALGVYKAASEIGLKIPYDIDVICFGHAKSQNFLQPPLSCINQPTNLLANEAINLLLNNIRAAGDIQAKQVLVDTNLILRGTAITNSHKNNVA